MAYFYTPTEEEQAAYIEWAATRPIKLRELAIRVNPWKLYRLKSSGHRVTIVAFEESGYTSLPMIRVVIRDRFNPGICEVEIFVNDPDELEECDL